LLRHFNQIIKKIKIPKKFKSKKENSYRIFWALRAPAAAGSAPGCCFNLFLGFAANLGTV
jgi:hypothetical protein